MHIIEFSKNLVINYGVDLAIIVVFIAIMAMLVKRGKKDLVKKIVFNLVVKAEAALGSGTGELKYNMVLTELYNKLPWIIRIFYTKKEIDKLIQESLGRLKEYLGQGKNLLSYEQEKQLQQLPPESVLSNAELNGIP